LVSKEKEYIKARFPSIKLDDLIFEKVQEQGDNYSCGIFAAAFATDVALGKNPCDANYSKDMTCMRHHFYNIVEKRKLSPFPSQ